MLVQTIIAVVEANSKIIYNSVNTFFEKTYKIFDYYFIPNIDFLVKTIVKTIIKVYSFVNIEFFEKIKTNIN